MVTKGFKVIYLPNTPEVLIKSTARLSSRIFEYCKFFSANFLNMEQNANFRGTLYN